MKVSKPLPIRVRVQVSEHQGNRHENVGSLMFYETTGDELYERLRRWALESGDVNYVPSTLRRKRA